MTIPQPLPDPLDLQWVIEVRRGPAVWHVRPDQLDYYTAACEAAVDGQVHRRCPLGTLDLGESEFASLRSFAARSPR